MVKILTILGWLSGAVGVVMMLLGVISVFAGGVFLDSHWKNYFYPGVGFVILGVFGFVATWHYKECECECHDKPKE
ncbi:MAG TPA: hypothetical protein VLH61_06510 [Bacteroidales bacterium]|nr:hypothetical protein [Bacteroidales bacterium]